MCGEPQHRLIVSACADERLAAARAWLRSRATERRGARRRCERRRRVGSRAPRGARRGRRVRLASHDDRAAGGLARGARARPARPRAGRPARVGGGRRARAARARRARRARTLRAHRARARARARAGVGARRAARRSARARAISRPTAPELARVHEAYDAALAAAGLADRAAVERLAADAARSEASARRCSTCRSCCSTCPRLPRSSARCSKRWSRAHPSASRRSRPATRARWRRSRRARRARRTLERRRDGHGAARAAASISSATARRRCARQTRRCRCSRRPARAASASRSRAGSTPRRATGSRSTASRCCCGRPRPTARSSSRRCAARACPRTSRAARGAQIRAGARCSRCSRARPRVFRRAGSRSTSRSARSRRARLAAIRRAAPAPGERWVPPDEELVARRASARRRARSESEREPDSARGSGSLPAPRRWERLLVEAAVIGGRDRWQRRLDGYARELERSDRRARGSGRRRSRERLRRDRADLAQLRAFALPLVDELAELPAAAHWGEWIDALGALAARALRSPERVQSVLAELAPMAQVGPIGLREVQLVLAPRLQQVASPPPGARYGKVFVAPIDAARGLEFDVVFVPGLAEKLFPRKIGEEPILLDAVREQLGAGLATNERASKPSAWRCASRSARRASARCSRSRASTSTARARACPSFYALEALRAAEGVLPGFDELSRRAETSGEARLGWPAPAQPEHAIDAAEYDLARLAALEGDDGGQPRRSALSARREPASRPRAALPRAALDRGLDACGRAREADRRGPTRARAARARRAQLLADRAPALRAVPYRFFLHAVWKLAPREEPEAIEELDPLQRGSLVHEVQFELFGELRDAGLLPVTPARLDAARGHLDGVLEKVAARLRGRARARDRAGLARRRDVGARRSARVAAPRERGRLGLRAVALRALLRPAGRSRRGSRVAGCAGRARRGLCLRGSIDLVERAGDGRLRVTDHKTGKERFDDGRRDRRRAHAAARALRARAREAVPGRRGGVGPALLLHRGGRLRGAQVALDDAARAAARAVAETVGAALDEPFLPAAPEKDACRWCDYRPVCGPYEEQRVARKYPAAARAAASRCGSCRERRPKSTPRRAAGSPSTSTRRCSSRPRRAPARRPRWWGASWRCCAAGARRSTRVVALTFTDKAAGEMRLRLRAELEIARVAAQRGQRRAPPARRRARAARARADRHDPRVLRRPAPGAAGRGGRRPAVRDRGARRGGAAARARVRRLVPERARRSARRRAPVAAPALARARRAQRARDAVRRRAPLVEHRDYTARWRRDPFDRERAIDAVMHELDALAELAPRASHPDDWLAKNLANVARFVSENRRREAVRGRDHDALEAELREPREDAQDRVALQGPNRRDFGPGVLRADVLARRDAAKQQLDRADRRLRRRPRGVPAARAAARWWSATKSTSAPRACSTSSICSCARATCSCATRRCAPSSRAASPTSSSTSSRTPIRSRPRSCCCSSPTIPAQRDWRAAVPAPGRLFVVGDPKQSIYRFRRADVAMYEQIKERLVAHGAELVLLRASFRAVPAIQDAVNAAFAPEMQAAADRSQAAYVALEPVRADRAGTARGGGGAGAAALRRLRHGRRLADRRIAARRGRRVRRLAAAARAAGPWKSAASACPSPRATSACCSAASGTSATT